MFNKISVNGGTQTLFRDFSNWKSEMSPTERIWEGGHAYRLKILDFDKIEHFPYFMNIFHF